MSDYVDTMVEQYIVTALWSTYDGSDENGGEPMDANYGPDDLAPETVAATERICREFYDANAADLATMDAGQAGHDLWLTREHHGAGFWDRGLGARGDRLTDAAQAYGEGDWYIGDDGLVYGTD